MKNLSNQQKKDAVRFVVAGLIAVILKKAEKAINAKADEHFGPDEPKKSKKKH
jgi:hypothetical protein